jgi:hypothetical protein
MEHTITSVWQKVDAALEQELVEFWLAEKVFAGEAPARTRAKEVVCIGRDGAGKIAGVCSVAPRILPRLRERMYYYRSYVRPADRLGGLALNLLLAAKTTLFEFETAREKPQCVGILMEIENRELAKKWNHAFWHPSGFSFIGYSPRGFDLRVWYFEGVRLQRLRIRPAAGAAAARPAVAARRQQIVRGGAARRPSPQRRPS